MYFEEVLYKIIKKEFGIFDCNIKLIKNEEKKIEKFVYNKICLNKAKIENTKIIKNKQSLKIFNPITSHIYYKISYIYLSQIASNFLF